jgi:FkbM family methyltransferase
MIVDLEMSEVLGMVGVLRHADALKEFARLLLPPVALDLARRFRKPPAPSQPASGTMRTKYGDFYMECDASHNLPRILADLPDYGRNVAELVRALQTPEPIVIDVGANIGDTALVLARFAPGARVLCIEGDRQFLPFLASNTAQIPGVTIAQAVLSDRSSAIKGRFEAHRGTAHLVLEETGEAFETRTLDDLLRDYPRFSRPDVIKIDTDGFDAPIMRGAREVLASSRPVVFYEWDPHSYEMAGENDSSHAELLRALGFDSFIIFGNRGELLLQIRRPGPEVWASLARFARARRPVDGWYYDVAAFPEERRAACEALWQHYSKVVS